MYHNASDMTRGEGPELGWLARLHEDIQVARERDPAARSAFEVLIAYPGIHALMIHRFAQGLSRRGMVVLPRMIAHLGRWLTGIEIHPRAQIGRRLFIDHGMGIVIGETAIIGDDCHLYQEVTLGGTSTRREKRHPTLEDHVVVGAGAKIIGAITIGSHTRIGAGSVVVSNVPPYATVVGVPGHIVAYTNASNDTVERLPDPEWDRIGELERRIADLERRSSIPTPGGGFDDGGSSRDNAAGRTNEGGGG
jgi:serine O-acetyltransferase